MGRRYDVQRYRGAGRGYAIIKELGVSYKEGANGTYIMDSVHTTSALIYQATKAGATIFNCYSVEDVVFHNDAVAGVVVNWLR